MIKVQTYLGNDVVNGNRVVVCTCVDYNITKWLLHALYLECSPKKWRKLILLKTNISRNCVLENGADLYVNEGKKLSECRVGLAEGRKKKEGEKSIFDHIWFSRKTTVS